MRRGRGSSLPAGFARWAGRWAAAWGLALLAGCGDYDPPVAADHDAAGYQADLAACQTTGDAAADRLAKATFPMFVSYPISLPFEQRVQISRCMAAKGYKDRG